MQELNDHINVFRGEIIHAEYCDLDAAENHGNPLLSALPRFEKAAQSRLWVRPSFTPEDRQKEGHLRSELAWSLTDLFVPLPHVLALERDVSFILRSGYQNRNPARPKYWPEAFRQVSFETNEAGAKFSPTLSSLQGISGTGKTASVRRILSQYPQVINHTGRGVLKSPHLQLVWLTLQHPAGGSPKDLCANFFQSVDDILGTDYLELYNRPKALPELISQAARVAIAHSLGLLIIDQVPFSDHQGTEAMISAVHWLSAAAGVPVLVVVTDDSDQSVSLFTGNSSNASSKDLRWERLENDAVWKEFVTPLWEYQYLSQPVPLTAELNDALFRESHGILDLAVKIFLMAQQQAIATKTETLTPGLIRSVGASALKLVRETLG